MMADEPDRPLSISDPDADGFVWICDASGHACFNLGTKEEAAELMSGKLGEWDWQEEG